jgi:lipopolysaccharide transport system permease protein
MNHTSAHSTSLISLIKTLKSQKYLLWQLIRREVVGRYKGSVLGIVWSFVNPLLMLAVYTFVFSVIFKMKWSIDNGSTNTEFAMMLFTGLILHSLLAEVLNKSPSLIADNVNYVKRVIFPLEALSIVTLGAALFHALISFMVLLLVLVLFQGGVNWTIFLFPLVILPLVLLILGISWLLCSLGVYLRDVSQVTAMLTMVLLFLTPIFYPLSMVPERFQGLIFLNPLTLMVEQAREVVILGVVPNMTHWAIYFVVSILVVWLGFSVFQKTRQGFADVL